MNEKFYNWMEEVGFFGGSVQDTTHESVDEFFTEGNFRGTLDYNDEMFAKMADELGMEEIDWDRVRYLAHDVLDDWLQDITKAAAVMGRKGGKASTPAKSAAAKKRANLGLAEGREKLAALTPKQRKENAKKAAETRWSKK
ncbi:MAG: hypothetical protein WCT05_16220 [Lentisphaeria bacterium]